MLYELCALTPPFKAEDMHGLFKKVLKGQYPQIPTHFSMDMRQLIKAMLSVDPSDRPTCDEILELSYVQKRIRKYFTDKDGKLLPIMQDSTKAPE